MFKALLNIFKVEDLRKRVSFTLFLLIVARVGVQIPVPGIHLPNLLGSFGSQTSSNGILGFINLFTGGGLSRASIFSLGIMPYITATIILQLLTAIFPPLDHMVKEGPEGRKKFHQYGRYGAILISVIQGMIYGEYLIGFNRSTSVPFLMVPESQFLMIFVLSVMAGTLILMWLGEQITEKGVGNGISLIILAGILSRVPGAIYQLFMRHMNPMDLTLILLMLIFVVVLVVFEEQGLRKIPIQYARQQATNTNPYAAMQNVSYLPFKINPTGVLPIIFASSVLFFPAQIVQWIGSDAIWLHKLVEQLTPGRTGYSVVYFLLVIFFAYFYIEVELNPKNIADNLRKQGAFIMGFRPGKETEKELCYILYRLTLPGAAFLGLIALFPTFVVTHMGLPTAFAYLMGGTSLLIMVGVSLDTIKQIDASLQMHHLERFLK